MQPPRRRPGAHPPPRPAPAPAPPAPAPTSLEQEDFATYVHFRILDGMGHPGAYKKFLLKRRDAGAEWAVRMQARVAALQQGVKAMTLLEQDIKTSHTLRNLHLVWQHVVENNTPPSDLQLMIGTCLITGKANIPCIVIKGKGRGAHNFTVSSKFATFLYHLWITYKMDILIKVYTRKCLDEIDPHHAQPISQIVQQIGARSHEIRSLARSLHAAYAHVYRSAVSGLTAVV